MPKIDYIDEGEDGMIESILAAFPIKTEKGGPGSGSWEAPGQPRFAWAPSSSAELKSHLGKGTKLILSAERSNLSPEENAKRTANFKQSLQMYSDEIVPQKGVWGGKSETSFVVSLKSQEDADKLERIAFKVLDQEAVIRVNDGKMELRYQTGKKETSDVKDIEVDPSATDNYSEIGGVKYRIPFKE